MSSSVHPHEMSPKTENVDSGVDIKTCTSPLAFTVNFDDDNDEEEDRRNNNNNNSNGSSNQPHKKLLNLQDGFSRFSPKSSRFTSSKSAPKHLPDEEEKKKRSSLVVKTNEDDEDGSETGTYTIDDEDDDDVEGEESESTKEGSWNEISTSRDEDWISRWAEEQARQQQKIKQQHQRRRNKTPPNGGQLDNSDENCRFRRKLPRLPSSSNHSNDSRETEDLLKDTLSVVNAMEARIEESSAASHETQNKVAKGQRPLKASASTTRVSSSSSLKNGRLLGAAVAAKKAAAPDAKELAKMSELEAWKRRKNYRPTPLANTPPKLRASADRITSGASEGGGRITRAALRSSAISNISGSKSGTSNKKICSKAGNNHGRSTSSMSSKDAEFQAWKRRKNYNPLQAVANSKKKTSLSTTQGAASVGNSLGNSNNSTSSTPSPRHVDRGIAADDYENERTLHSLQGLKVSSNTSSVMPPRSASFHYPEGGQLKLSSSLINFTSDEDDEELESLDFDDTTSCSQVGNHLKQHRLQQSSRSSLLGGGNKSQSRKLLNDGDLSESTSTIVRIPSSSSGLGGGSPSKAVPLSSKSHQKLEALDNLVISTIFSVSTKLCISSQNLLQKVRTSDLELSSIIDTLLYVLDDTDPPVSPSKKTSRELSGTLRNLKKVEQVLQVLERLHAEDEEE